MGLFFKGKTYPLGLDISDSSLKLVQLDRGRKGKISLKAISYLSLPKGFIIGGDIKNQDELVKSLKKVVSKSKLSRPNTRQVVASLPESKTFIKLIKVKDLINKIDDIIESEMEKHLPFSSKDVYCDWQVIEEKADYKLVLIGAAPRRIVEDYYNLLNQAGFIIEALEIEPIAICRAILEEETPIFENTQSKNYILIDLGFSHSTIVFYSKNTILFTTETQLSGEKITKDIAKRLEVSEAQAEKIKINLGPESKNYKQVVEVIESNLEELNIKLRRAVDFYYDSFSDQGPIEKVILVGGGAYTEKIEEAIDCLPASVEIEKSDPFSKVSQGRKVKEMFKKERNSLCFTTAVGLALSRVFIKED